MKRALLIVGGIVVLLVVVVGVVVFMTFSGMKPVVDGFEVGGIRIVADGIVTAAVVPVGADQVALIDAGNDTEGKALLAELSRRKLGPDAVVAIFLTHGHPDHIGAVHLFPKAQVMALRPEVAMVEGREGGKGPIAFMMPVSPTGITVSRPLADGENVMIGDVSVRAFAVPGHTGGSAAYLVNGVLFTGDAAAATSDGHIQGSPWLFSDDQAQDRASLVRLAGQLAQGGTSVTAIAPAHSGVLTDGLTQLEAYARAQGN